MKFEPQNKETNNSYKEMSDSEQTKFFLALITHVLKSKKISRRTFLKLLGFSAGGFAIDEIFLKGFFRESFLKILADRAYREKVIADILAGRLSEQITQGINDKNFLSEVMILGEEVLAQAKWMSLLEAPTIRELADGSSRKILIAKFHNSVLGTSRLSDSPRYEAFYVSFKQGENIETFFFNIYSGPQDIKWEANRRLTLRNIAQLCEQFMLEKEYDSFVVLPTDPDINDAVYYTNGDAPYTRSAIHGGEKRLLRSPFYLVATKPDKNN